MNLRPETDVSEQPRKKPSMRTVQYAFTITLSPKVYKHTAEEQYDKTRRLIDEWEGYGVRITAIAELHTNFNLHYHGVVCYDYDQVKALCKDPRKLFFDHLRKYPFVGRQVKLKDIDDWPGWVEYLTKALVQTDSALGRFPVVRDDHGVVPTGKFCLYNIVHDQ